MSPASANKRRPPSGLSRLFYRAPITLYRLGLGGLLGGRFLLLNHTGRKSGLPRQTVLEVVDSEPAANRYTVVSAWGEASDWYRNILAAPEVTIQVGRKKLAAVAKPLTPEASGEAMVRYARQHPATARRLMQVIGLETTGAEADYRRLGRESLRFVNLVPRPVG